MHYIKSQTMPPAQGPDSLKMMDHWWCFIVLKNDM